ncbi:magnesium chelatase [bacterium]|nr:MAG: magnesium chelatase [bacterium]
MKPSSTTLAELKLSGWKSRTVKEELRENLITKLRNKETLFPGIVGYDKTVIPQITQAILAQHDLLLLGLRGQAKTRILRSLVSLLDEYMPEIEGSELHDDPFNPISKFGKHILSVKGDETPIHWVHRSERYSEKLATPDTTVADLIGDIDPIKAATKKLNLSDEEVIHFGLIPRANRCLFVINELPDLQPRIQVALLNIMQERDIQIRGFTVRMPLDIGIYFSANPEDYTNRGNIITPLKDRIDSQIITHYPKELQHGIEITQQEAWMERGGIQIVVPHFIKEIVESIAFEGRTSEYIDQKSGISARMSISAMEQLISAAERRAIWNGEESTVVRVLDMYQIIPALTGKLELVYEGEQEGASNVAKHLIGKAIRNVFVNYFDNPQPDKKSKEPSKTEQIYAVVTDWFALGNTLDLDDLLSDKRYRAQLDRVSGLRILAGKFGSQVNEGELYVMMEFILESLYQYSKLGKQSDEDGVAYKDMLGSMLGGINFNFDDEE